MELAELQVVSTEVPGIQFIIQNLYRKQIIPKVLQSYGFTPKPDFLATTTTTTKKVVERSRGGGSLSSRKWPAF